MGKPVDNEVVLRNRAKEVRSLIIEKQEIDKAIEIIRDNEEILTFDYGRSKYLSLLPTIRLEKGLKNKYQLLEKVIQVGVEIYNKNGNYEDLVFFAAASCAVENLHKAFNDIPTERRNKTREGDTILLFFVKFANLENPLYIQTLKILINGYKIFVNQADYKDHSPIIILLNKYASLQRKGIIRHNDVLLNAVSILLTRSSVDLISHKINNTNAHDIIKLYNLEDHLEQLRKHMLPVRLKSEIEDEKNILFALLAQKREDDFLKTFGLMQENETIVDIEDGNNTLLQLCCEKNLEVVAKKLIKLGANLIKTTKRNRKTPLEITARRNFFPIFSELLKSNKIIIDLELFTVFLLNRGRQIKTKYFDQILCYDRLQLDIAYANGNTPLHYAIIFENTEATLMLLKRGASILARNNNGKTPLDYISKEVLELYFDQCILLDNHNKMNNNKYEIRLDFDILLQTHTGIKHTDSEIEVISKISSSSRLNCLATHPLILTFMEVKWSVTLPLYNNILTIYGFFFIYYFMLAIFVGHMTLLSSLTMLLLIFFTLHSSINLKNKKSYMEVVIYVLFTFLVYFLIENKHVCNCTLMATCFYQFILQHLYFPKYQALIVNTIRKVTLHVLAFFGLFYVSNFEDFSKNSKIIFPVIIYMLIVTYSFNALVDNVVDIEHSFKTLYNKNTLNFIKFSENMYNMYDTVLCNPYIRNNVNISNFESKRKNSKFFLHYLVNKNKILNEHFHFVKLDAAIVKILQNFVVRVSQNTNQSR